MRGKDFSFLLSSNQFFGHFVSPESSWRLSKWSLVPNISNLSLSFTLSLSISLSVCDSCSRRHTHALIYSLSPSNAHTHTHTQGFTHTHSQHPPSLMDVPPHTPTQIIFGTLLKQRQRQKLQKLATPSLEKTVEKNVH